MNIFLNEYFGFCFELNFELNHFWAKFNEKMNFQNVSNRATIVRMCWQSPSLHTSSYRNLTHMSFAKRVRQLIVTSCNHLIFISDPPLNPTCLLFLLLGLLCFEALNGVKNFSSGRSEDICHSTFIVRDQSTQRSDQSIASDLPRPTQLVVFWCCPRFHCRPQEH